MSDHLERAQAFLDGRLGSEERASFEAHLATCAQCHALVGSWRTFTFAYTARPVPEPRLGETQRLIRKATHTHSRRPLIFVTAGLVAAVLIAVLALWPSDVPIALDGVAVTTPLLETQGTYSVGADQLSLTAGSAVRVLSHTPRRVALQLDRGTLTAAVNHRRPDQSFTVSVSGFQVSVIGTRFSVSVVADGFSVQVDEGHVQVSGTQSRLYDVRSGEILRVMKGEATLLPTLQVPEPPLDAGVTEPVEEVDDEAAPLPMRTVKPATLEKWRRAALSGQCETVIAGARRALVSNANQSEVWRVLADCQRMSGHSRDAIAAYQRVVAMGRPDEADRARLFVADLQLQSGNAIEAVRALQLYLAHSPQPPLEAAARVKLAQAYLRLGQRTAAKAELVRVTQKLGSTPAAIEALELLKNIDSSSAPAK